MNDRSSATRTVSPSTSSSLIDSDHVQGTGVFDPRGKDIGTVKRLVIDKLSGRVVYAVAQFGGFLGLGGKEYTIPWDKLNYVPRLGGFQTDITEEQLRGAPAFGQNGNEGYADRNSETTLLEYYGSRQYWD
jgi:sporulation protein YlmC with PRC-barrel domain